MNPAGYQPGLPVLKNTIDCLVILIYTKDYESMILEYKETRIRRQKWISVTGY